MFDNYGNFAPANDMKVQNKVFKTYYKRSAHKLGLRALLSV